MRHRPLQLTFHGNLPDLLPRGRRCNLVEYRLDRRANIKDIIESLQVPHPEVGAILRSGRPLPFNYLPRQGDFLDIHPFTRTTPLFQPTPLRPQPLPALAFITDDTVLKLERNMRMAGFDTAHLAAGRLTDKARQVRHLERILISRNRDLLRCRDILFGQLIRSVSHHDQLGEVMRRFLRDPPPHPFSRCLVCNSPLEAIAKEAILHRLEPLTRKHYHSFKRCPQCQRIFWPGSHVQRMAELLNSAGSGCISG